MDIVICDDTEKDADCLRLFVERYFEELNCNNNILMYSSGDSLLKDFAAGKMSDLKIAFLDIYMPGTNGVDTAKWIRKSDKDIVIVFTTTSRDHSLEGYSVYALQYLVKPLSYTEVSNVLDKCMEKYADSLKYIEVLSDRLNVRAYLKDIMYVECFDTSLHIHTTMETIKTFLSLSEMEKKLEGSTFLRTQRSYIVNMRYIEDMASSHFVLTNGTKIPIRRSEKQSVKQAYRSYLSNLTLET